MPSRTHVFISHHHRDDEHVTRLSDLLNRNGCEIRNSSIRAKPANQRKLDQGLISEATIKRLLRMKMSWASTVVVLIGRDTHAREWVDWEIRKAHELGKRIVGVFTRGGTQADIPIALEDYADSIVNWNAGNIIAAIEGRANQFQNPDGSSRDLVNATANSRC